MKKTVLFLMVILFITGSCTHEKASRIEYIDESKGKNIKCEVIILAGEDQDFYDIQILEDHYAVLDYEKDTPLHIYTRNGNKLLQSVATEKDVLIPRFLKTEASAKQNVFQVLNNRLGQIDRFEPDNSNGPPSQQHQLPSYVFNFGTFPHLSECMVTARGIYGTLLQPVYDNTFYYFKADSGVIFGEPHLSIDRKLPNQPLAYACHIGVNEKAGRIVTASRFTNTIHLYDLNGKLQKVLFFGSHTINPVRHATERGILDIENSIKCFIGVRTTPEYIYCLYSGNENVSAIPSRIIVLNRKGKYIRTLNLDRGLTAFDIDPSGKTIMGTSRVENGTEIVSYKIK